MGSRCDTRHDRSLLGFQGLRPEVAIEPDLELDSRNPFSTQFRFHNHSWYALRDVSVSCIILEVVDARTRLLSGANLTVDGSTPLAVLGHDESLTKNCNLGIRFAFIPIFTKADVVLQISYRLPWLTRTGKRERFVGRSDDKGVIHWSHQPIGDALEQLE